ncbi:MAG: hypothetical protein CMJ18_04640 [Phycisphaeraceae bacterium]|nr:hypothetical protein [Phycisphaeraceae bacterium]
MIGLARLRPASTMKRETLCHIDFRRDPNARYEWAPVSGRATTVAAYMASGPEHPEWANRDRYAPEPSGLRLRGGSLLGGWFSARGTTRILLTPARGVVEVSVGRSAHSEHCVALDVDDGSVRLRTLQRRCKRDSGKQGHFNVHPEWSRPAVARVALRPGSRVQLVIHNDRSRLRVDIGSRTVMNERVTTRCGGIVGIYADDAMLHCFHQSEWRTEREYARHLDHQRETIRLGRRMTRAHREDLETHTRIERAGHVRTLVNAFADTEIRWDGRSGRITSARSAGGSQLLARPFPALSAVVDGRRYELKRASASGFTMDPEGARWTWTLTEKGGRVTLDVSVVLRFHLNGLIVWTVTPARQRSRAIDWRIDAVVSASLRHKDRCDWLIPINQTDVAIIDSDLARNVHGQCTLHDGKHGFSVYLDGIDEQRMREVPGTGSRAGRITAFTQGRSCRFYTVLSPHQVMSPEAFSKRIVHCCYQDWAKGEAADAKTTGRELPSMARLRRFRKAGANCIVLHQSWMDTERTRWAEMKTSDVHMRRLRHDCDALGLELAVYISPRWLPMNDPGLRWRHRHLPPYFFDGPAEQRLCYLSYAESATAVHWAHCARVLRRYRLDGIYLDGGQSIDWAASADPALERTERQGYIERVVRQMYGLWRLVQDAGGRFGLEGYGESSGPMRCAYQAARIYGESRDAFTPEMMRNHNNGLLNSGKFNLWGWNARARRAWNFGVCAVSLADMCMVVGNSSGADDGTPAEWARLAEYWGILDRVDFANLIDMQPWWMQSTVRVGAYAATYRWPGHCLVLLLARGDARRDVVLRFDWDRLGMKSDRAEVRRLRPPLSRPLRPQAGAIRLRLPAPGTGYAALMLSGE